MGILMSQLVIDSHDPAALAAWWAEALGREVEADGEDEVWLAPTAKNGSDQAAEALP